MAFELGGEVGKILLLISLSKRQGMSKNTGCATSKQHNNCDKCRKVLKIDHLETPE